MEGDETNFIGLNSRSLDLSLIRLNSVSSVFIFLFVAVSSILWIAFFWILIHREH